MQQLRALAWLGWGALAVRMTAETRARAGRRSAVGRRVLYGAWHLPISEHTMLLLARDGGEQAVGTLMEVSDGIATRSCVVEQR